MMCFIYNTSILCTWLDTKTKHVVIPMNVLLIRKSHLVKFFPQRFLTFCLQLYHSMTHQQMHSSSHLAKYKSVHGAFQIRNVTLSNSLDSEFHLLMYNKHKYKNVSQKINIKYVIDIHYFILFE